MVLHSTRHDRIVVVLQSIRRARFCSSRVWRIMHVCNGYRTVDVGPWMGGHAVAAEKVRVHVRAPHMHMHMHVSEGMNDCMSEWNESME